MKVELLETHLSVYQVTFLQSVPFDSKPIFVSLTEEEISVVSAIEDVPKQTIQREDGWRALKVSGPLAFELVEILASISSILADAQVSIFAVSTYNTDYILIKETMLSNAVDALCTNGFEVIDTTENKQKNPLQK